MHIAGLTPNPQRRMDDADGPEFNDDGMGLPDSRAACAPRARYQVLLHLSGEPEGGWGHPHQTSRTQSEFECPCGALG